MLRTNTRVAALDGRLAQPAAPSHSRGACLPVLARRDSSRQGTARAQAANARATRPSATVFLACGLYEDRPPPGSGPWATVCRPAAVTDLSKGEGLPLDTYSKLRNSTKFIRKTHFFLCTLHLPF